MTGTSPPFLLLTVAGTDPTSGAGISADLATFRDFGGYGTSVISALVDQGTSELGSVLPTPEPFFAGQMGRLLAELPPRAVKIGLVPTPGLVMQLASALDALAPHTPRVLDPVLANGRGESLVEAGTVEAITATLLPRVTLVTPNAPEAARLSGLAVDDLDGAVRASRVLVGRGAGAVLVKGGHLPGAPGDVLATADGEVVLENEVRAEGGHAGRPDVHGTGCHLASAAAALLALGVPLREACEGARAYLSAVVAAAGRPGDGARHVVLHGPETRAAAEAAVSAALTSPGRTRAPLGGGGAT